MSLVAVFYFIADRAEESPLPHWGRDEGFNLVLWKSHPELGGVGVLGDEAASSLAEVPARLEPIQPVGMGVSSHTVV
jgi:hypothetical protein